MNFYEQPAQAQFVNTYVPIPFEQLMSVANAYKQDYDKNLESLRQYNKEAGEFQSLSTKDTDVWKAATLGRVEPIINQMSSNPDALKDITNRAKLNQLITSTDYGLLSKLKTNASMLSEAAKTYDPRWEDDTMQKLANWDTMNQGIYTGRNLEYKNLQDISNPYFDLLGKEKFLGKSKDGLYDEYGIQMPHLQSVADDKTINEIYESPEGKKHVELAHKRGLVPEGMSDKEWLKEAVIQSQIGRVGITRREENKFALEDYRERIRRASKKGKEEDIVTPPPTKYDQLVIDADRSINQSIATSGFFDAEGLSSNIQAQDEVAAETMVAFQANKEALFNKQITPEQFQNNINRISKEADLVLTPLETKQKDIFSKGVADMFKANSGIDLRTGESNKIENTKFYNASAYRAAGQVINALAPTAADAAYLDMWHNVETNSDHVTVNFNGVPTNAVSLPTTAGSELVTEYVNKLGKGNLKYQYSVKKADGSMGNISKDLANGAFRGAVAVPSHKYVTQTGKNGEKEIAQLYTLLVPNEAISEAGYDQSSFATQAKEYFGDRVITNISDKNVSKKTVRDAYGAELEPSALSQFANSVTNGWLGSAGTGDADRIPQSLVGKFYQFEVMRPMPRSSSVTNTTESLYDKKIGGSAYSKGNVDYRAVDIYGNDNDNAEMQRQMNGN